MITLFYLFALYVILSTMYHLFNVENALIKMEEYSLNKKLLKEGTIAQIPADNKEVFFGVLLIMFIIMGLFTYNGFLFLLFGILNFFFISNLIIPLMDKRIYDEEYNESDLFDDILYKIYYFYYVGGISILTFILLNKFYFRIPLHFDFIFDLIKY